MQTLLDRIRGVMHDSGLSVKALAETTGIPRVTLARRFADPDALTLAEIDRIADALNVTPLYLLTGDVRTAS